MALFQSLICWYGYDDRKRFSIINLSTYFIFILASVALSQQLTLSFITLFILIACNLFTTQRRLNDAGLKKNWLVMPSVAFFITACVILLTTSGVFYWLLLFPIVISALLLTYPSKQKRHYILGYQGPIDLSQYIKTEASTTNRIEPSLFSHPSQQAPFQSSPTQDEVFEQDLLNPLDEKEDLGELIRLSLLSHQNALISLAGVASVIVVAIVISLVISNKSIPTVEIETPVIQEVSNSLFSQVKHAPVELPDNFTLLLSEHNGLIVHWNSDKNHDDALIWSQFSAIGDNSCEVMLFNKGSKVRPLVVKIEDITHYYAYFSPLDTQTLVRAIAYQSSFTLCGYEFSLKGSQAVVGKNDTYSDYLAQ